MPYYLRVLLVVALTGLVLAGVRWLIRRPKALMLEQPSETASGTIRPGLWSAWFTVVVGSAIGAVALWAAIFAKGGGGAALMALLGAAIAGFMAPSITSIHAVHWNEQGIDGPTKLFGPTLGLARASIAWADIVKMGTTRTGYWYVEARDGRRVYWSYLYKGYRILMATLQKRCPILKIRF